ncbi:hypothetical protein GCM10023116_48230 [Kistimonas scapharcae]|uniref:Tail fiber protein n=1 Tax=Kistimonas scapharcae TaxID=1036133 RepID=A0ABP8V9A9_9GAMM
MSQTRPTGDQIRFTSQYTGEHILDLYLEACEKSGRQLPDMLDDLFDESGVLKASIELRYNVATKYLEYRNGDYVDPETGWVALDTLSFFNTRGDYADATDYNNLDIVNYNNGVMICSEAHTSSGPTPDMTRFNVIFDPTYIDNATAQVKADKNATAASAQSVADTKAAIDSIKADIDTQAATVTQSETNAAQSETQAAASATSASTDAGQVSTDRSTVQTLRDETHAFRNETEVFRNEASTYVGSLQGTISEFGAIDLSANTYPTKPATSAVWFVSVGGTVDAIEYRAGDSLFYSLVDDAFYRTGKGLDGTDGLSAYQVWLNNGGSGTEQDFIDSLKGVPGDKGDTGDIGDSAYQVWLDAGNSGTEADFIDSLKGDPGDKGSPGPGLPPGGTAGQMIEKVDGTDYNTQWVDPASGGLSSVYMCNLNLHSDVTNFPLTVGYVWVAHGSDVVYSNSKWYFATAGIYEVFVQIKCLKTFTTLTIKHGSSSIATMTEENGRYTNTSQIISVSSNDYIELILTGSITNSRPNSYLTIKKLV